MARSTPTYTPKRNYAIGLFLSALLLFRDISYGTFNPVRGFVNSSTIYIKTISIGIFENVINTFSSFQQNKNLIKENKRLKEKILQIRIEDFINKKVNQEKLQTIDFKENYLSLLKNNNIDIYKIASIDLRNYLCCSTHRIYLKNNNNFSPEKNLPVFAGESYVGQTKATYLNFIEVILFSDTNHVLPIKSDSFYCDARGKGKPMLISCKLNKNNEDLKNQIGDAVYTSGLGGVFLKDVKIGFISAITSFSQSEIEILITLKANPLEENFYGIMSKDVDEI